jgi:subtilisin family serine protease
MADENGHVKVIVAISGGLEVATDPVDALFSAKCNRGFSSEVLAELKGGIRTRYSYALTGFSADLDVNVVPELLHSYPFIQIYPDFEVKATLTDSLAQVGADQMWTRVDGTGRAVTGQGIVVAVVDTGVFYDHPDLGGGYGPNYKVIGGYDFYNNDDDPADDNGHGTHVAGTIAANGSTKGIAPDAKILAYKVLGPDGSGSMSSVIAAIDRAMDPNQDGSTSDHADVISMSLGGPGEEGDPACIAVSRAVAAGIVVVVAAGNSGPAMGTVASPGIASDAITVGAVNSSGVLANFSSRGTNPKLEMKPDLSAPGVGILSTVPYSGTRYCSPSGYMSMSGTSMATPHVSGGVALLKQLHPDWTPAEIKSALVTGTKRISEPFWFAGAGQLWLPSAADTELLTDTPLVSYGLGTGQAFNVSISNVGTTKDLAVSAEDFHSVWGNESRAVPSWTNVSSVIPSSIHLLTDTEAEVSLTVGSVPLTGPEGYYDGIIHLSCGTQTVDIRFGFVVLSRVTVHVLNMAGQEVFDYIGGVWVYDLPDANVAMGKRGSASPAPPSTFLLPAGNYSVHAMGHQLIYSSDDPYVLSEIVTLGRLHDCDLYLRMTDAHPMVLNLQTQDGLPIYVKNYRVYWRHEGKTNVSYDLVGTDYSTLGSALFSLKRSMTVYVSNTPATIGISIAGFSYTQDMWNFMLYNWEHWYEYVDSSSVDFHIEASADLEYLLSWEFDGVDESTSNDLSIDHDKSSVYFTKYDIPGIISHPWCEWNTHSPIGGDASFFIRRSTYTSLDSFFSGMTRTTYVQGAFTELYYPQHIYDGYFEREYYVPDYGHLRPVSGDSGLYLPDRNFLGSIEGASISGRLGAGPYYPSVYTASTNTTLVMFQPLLRDQMDAKVGGVYEPTMRLYQGSSVRGTYNLDEYLTWPDAMRVISLPGAGSYSARIKYSPLGQVCTNVTIELSFTVPGIDVDPPRITGLRMPQRFLPGQTLPILLSAIDTKSQASVSMSWRTGSSDAWKNIVVTKLDSMNFSASVPTTTDMSSLDLMIRVSDASGNYICYTAPSVALEQVPVQFDLHANVSEVEFEDSTTSVVLSGLLKDESGNPLNAMGAVPLELMNGSRKLGVILDEYVVQGSHAHNGTIRFEWFFNPTELFSGPNQTMNIQVLLDLGLYEPITKTICLKSLQPKNVPPVITLNSPSNGSLIHAGALIDLDAWDDGTFSVEWYLDGVDGGALVAPWDLDTSAWTDGTHTVEVVATDDAMASTSVSFMFVVDSLAPSIVIISPMNESQILPGSKLTAAVTDAHLTDVRYSRDGGVFTVLNSPYEIDMAGWSSGNHTVTIEAIDAVGHSSSASVSFEIIPNMLVLSLDSPANGSIVKSGVAVAFNATGYGSITYRWRESGGWYELGAKHSFSTAGWSQGVHVVLINATSDIGGWDQIQVTITIDDIAPAIQLVSPLVRSFVTPLDQIVLEVSDDNIDSIAWTLWGVTVTTSSTGLSIPLTSSPADGNFAVYVTAIDKAGNEARTDFSFEMDSLPPSISLANVAPGSSVQQGSVLDVVVYDVYLAGVQWSLDAGDRASLAAPFDIDTSSFSVGWHSLQIAANDASGKSTTLTLSFYLDNEAPVVDMLSGTFFENGTGFSVRASVTDDYGVGSVSLYYELTNGSYASAPMLEVGGSYVAILPADMLWDGMDVYFASQDVAGNTALGPHAQLTEAVPSPESGSPIGNPGSASMIIFLGAVALILSVSLFFVSKRRDKDEETKHDSPVKDISSIGIVRPQPTLSRRQLPSAPASKAGSAMAQAAEMPAQSGQTVGTWGAVTRSYERRLRSPPALMESIPDTRPGDRQEEGETDYGDLIERELIIPSIRNSVLRGMARNRDSEIVPRLEELRAMMADRPKKTIE